MCSISKNHLEKNQFVLHLWKRSSEIILSEVTFSFSIRSMNQLMCLIIGLKIKAFYFG